MTGASSTMWAPQATIVPVEGGATGGGSAAVRIGGGSSARGITSGAGESAVAWAGAGAFGLRARIATAALPARTATTKSVRHHGRGGFSGSGSGSDRGAAGAERGSRIFAKMTPQTGQTGSSVVAWPQRGQIKPAVPWP